MIFLYFWGYQLPIWHRLRFKFHYSDFSHCNISFSQYRVCWYLTQNDLIEYVFIDTSTLGLQMVYRRCLSRKVLTPVFIPIWPFSFFRVYMPSSTWSIIIFALELVQNQMKRKQTFSLLFHSILEIYLSFNYNLWFQNFGVRRKI